MRQVARLGAIFCLLLGSTGMLLAQSATGQITGTVRDATAAVVIGAPVTVTSQLTGLTRTTTTNDAGGFSFPLLPVSVYTVKVDQKGFRSATFFFHAEDGIRVRTVTGVQTCALPI